MPYTIKPGSFKYKKSNGQFSEIDCFEGPDLTEEVAALEKGKAPIIIDSATGNPIALKDGADGLPVEGMKIHFLPKQNLNGQDTPYPPGGGKNKMPCPSIASTQTIDGITLVVDGNGQYKISGSNSSGSAINFTFNVQSQYIGNAQYLHCMNDKIGSVSGGVRIYLFNDNTQVDFVGFTGANRIYNGGSALNGKTINKIQIRIMDNCSVDGVLTFTPMLLDTSSVTEWTPYSNICPITRWTGLTAYRTGANLMDSPTFGDSGVMLNDFGKDILFDAVTFSFKANNTIAQYTNAAVVDLREEDGTHHYIVLSVCRNSSNVAFKANTETSGTYSRTLTNIKFRYVYVWYTGNSYSWFNGDNITEWQLEIGSAASPYTEYAGQSYPVTFPDGQTIYGGTLDAVNGVLTVDKVLFAFKDLVTLNGASANWVYNSTYNLFETQNAIIPTGTADTGTGIVCSCYQSRPYGYNSSYSSENSIVWAHTSGTLRIKDNRYTDVDVWKTAIADEQIVIPLATPVEIPIDPITVQTLLGNNTIWSDANGTIELDYRADTKLFCQKNDQVNDVQINGTSILNAQGVANVPLSNASTPGVAYSSGNYGINVNSNNGEMGIKCAGLARVKAGTNAYEPIVASHQHESVFYALAKLAGADMASSSNPVGQFTDDAIVKIQKMLGIYQAPWELIREDSFTNDLTTASDHIITVDSNGQPFELTDVLMLFELPQNENTAEKGYYGQIWFYYETDSVIAPEPGSASRAANGYSQGAWYMINYSNKIVTTQSTIFATNTNSMYWRARYIQYMNSGANSNMGMFVANDFAINKINIKQVKGEGHYKLYGRRKWTT